MECMGEFKKIDLSSSAQEDDLKSVIPQKSRMAGTRKNSFKKTTTIAVGILVFLGILSFFAIVLPAQRTYSSALKTYKQAKVAWDAIKKQDINKGSIELLKTKEELTKTQKELHSFSYVKYIPFLGGYYSDVDHIMNAGFQGVESAIILVDSVKPYADVLGFKGQGSFTAGTAETRIQTAIMTMGKVTPRIDEIAQKLKLAQKDIDQINPARYPSFIAGGKVRAQIEGMRTFVDEGVVFVDQARPLIKVLPSLLGESKEKKYMILFQNDKELRPTGGFLTAYAVFRVDRGNIVVDRADDIYNLDNSLRVRTKPPSAISKYLPKVTSFNLRDSNLSPDYVESMKTFNALYDKAGDKVAVNGIIALDTHVLASVIKILDDEVIAGGMKFTSKIDKRCNCPQVVYELEQITDKPKSLDLRVSNLAVINSQRKDIIGVLLNAIMKKALKSSPKLYWGPLIQKILQETEEKHVMFYLYDQDAQKGVEALNAAGRIKPYDGDYLHINDSNMGGAKSNMFVKQSVDQVINIASDGLVSKTVTISYKNPFPPSNCNLEAGLVCLNALLRDWVRMYIPKGSVLTKSSGSEVKVTTYDELDKTVFDGFITVKPMGTATYTLMYTLPFKIKSGSPLPLLIQKQPGTDNNNYTIKVNGKSMKPFELLTDKELKLTR